MVGTFFLPTISKLLLVFRLLLSTSTQQPGPFIEPPTTNNQITFTLE